MDASLAVLGGHAGALAAWSEPCRAAGAGAAVWAGGACERVRPAALSGSSQQDAQEFLKLLMERLHLEVNRRGRRAAPLLAGSPTPSPPRRAGARPAEPELR